MRPARSLTRLLAVLLAFMPLATPLRSGPPAVAADPVAELLEMKALPPEVDDEAAEPDDAAPKGAAQQDGAAAPPKDDAPIKQLIDYWSNLEAHTKRPEPSPATRQRLLEACEKRPDLLPPLLDSLPAATDTHDRLFRLLNEDPEDDGGWKEDARNWLRRNSGYFRDELIAAARAAKDGDEGSDASVANHLDLVALAELDAETARPILETLAASAMPEISTLALALLYEQAHKGGATARAESYRARLKGIVADAQASHGARVMACHSLAGAEWDGRDEWFLSLFTPQRQASPLPPALTEKLTRPLMLEEVNRLPPDVRDMILRAQGSKGEPETAAFFDPPPSVLLNDPDKFIPLVSRLVGHRDRATHDAAVSYLFSCVSEDRSGELHKRLLQPLLPWLTDPNWSATEGRNFFISALSGLEMPEIFTGLMWVLDHDEDDTARAAAAAAISDFRDARAVPALKRALAKEKGMTGRALIVTALAQCGGLSDEETAAAIEAYAEYDVAHQGEETWRYYRVYGQTAEPLPLDVSIGRILDESDEIAATEGLALRLLDRVKELKRSRPAVAARILKVIEKSPLHVVNLDLIRRIGANEADADVLKFALDIRDDLGKSVDDEIRALLKQGAQAQGIAAALLKDEGLQLDILKGADVQAQRALLACARLAGDKLPVEVVAKLLDGAKPLALAAERYLESEDSADARRVLYARHRDEAHILGAQVGFDPQFRQFPRLREWEEAMRREVRAEGAPEEVYALVSAGDPQGRAIIVRVRGGRGEVVVREDAGRALVRTLTDAELHELRDFASRPEIENLGSAFTSPHSGPQEYLRLTRAGGRRILTPWPRRTPKGATLHEQLAGLFFKLSTSGEFRLRYAMEEKIPGLEVLLAGERFHAVAVGQEGAETRVLAHDRAEAAKKRDWTGAAEWRVLSAGGLGEVTSAPSAFPAEPPAALPEGMRVRSPHAALWDPAGDVTVVEGAWNGEEGVWKIQRGVSPVKLLGGMFISPILTPDGRWLVALRLEGEAGLFRVNVATGRVRKVTLPADKLFMPVAFVAAHNRMLLGSGSGERGGAGEYALLDVATGGVQPVKGEFSPLRDRTQRTLQPTGRPHEFWAAVHDAEKNVTKFGRYDTNSFTFTSVIEMPEIQVGSQDTWVDAAAGKVYVVYRGHVLRLPLPK